MKRFGIEIGGIDKATGLVRYGFPIQLDRLAAGEPGDVRGDGNGRLAPERPPNAVATPHEAVEDAVLHGDDSILSGGQFGGKSASSEWAKCQMFALPL